MTCWIKLCIHPEHDKVLRIADLTGASNEAAFCASVRWFRWVDEHAESNAITVTGVALKTITRWPDGSLLAAFTHPEIDWLTQTDGKYAPTRWETHMSQGAKVRALTAKRVAKSRAGGSNAPSVTESAPREEKEKDINRERGRGFEIPVSRIIDHVQKENVWKALDAWSLATRKKPIDVVHNEAPAVHSAMAGWCQAKIPGVAWDAAVLRCIRAAQSDGTKFGDSPKYAIKVISAAIGRWENGVEPETALTSGGSQNGTGSTRTYGKPRTDERRASKRASEFAENITLPTVGGDPGGCNGKHRGDA